MATHRTSSNFNRMIAQEIVLTDGTNSARFIVRSGNLDLDYTKNENPGFDGILDTDYAWSGFRQDISD